MRYYFNLLLVAGIQLLLMHFARHGTGHSYEMAQMLEAAGILGASGIASSLLGKTKVDQVPLETPEQKAARQALLGFGQTGTLGGFTAGAEVPLGYGDYSATAPETQGLSSLQTLLQNGIPSQYKTATDALTGLASNDPAAIAAQFDPFKVQTERQIGESNAALKRSAGFAGGLYSTGTIKGLGDIQARGNETLTSKLADLTNSALDRKLQAASALPGVATAEQNATVQQIDASQKYGDLTRSLNDQAIKARDAELLRRRQELQLPIQALESVAGTPSNFGVPSVTTSPYQQLLSSVGQLGGLYAMNSMYAPTPDVNTEYAGAPGSLGPSWNGGYAPTP